MRFLAQGLVAAESIGHQSAIAQNLGTQATIHAQRKEWRQAALLLARSWQHYHRIGHHGGSVLFIGLVVLIMAAVGDDEASATLHGRAGGVTAFQAVFLTRALADQWADSEHALRRRLGDHRFDECATRGRSMDNEDLAAYVMEKLQQVTL